MTIQALADKTLSCPHCGEASGVGVCELEAAYRLGFAAGQAVGMIEVAGVAISTPTPHNSPESTESPDIH